MNLILCGYPACGKTTLAQAYSLQFNVDMMDTDSLMLQAISSDDISTNRELYLALGEIKFRQLEADIIQAIKPNRPTVIATGGGSVLNPSSVEHLKTLGKIIYLKTPQTVLNQRLNQQHRALSIQPGSRDAVYQAVAHDVLETEQHTLPTLTEKLHAFRSQHGQ
jgi:shikimate kinase